VERVTGCYPLGSTPTASRNNDGVGPNLDAEASRNNDGVGPNLDAEASRNHRNNQKKDNK